MDLKNVYWLAGLFEGDGNVKKLGKWGMAVEIALTDLDVLEKCQRLFGGKIYGPYNKNNGKGHNIKPMYSWTIQERYVAYGLFMMMFPLLGSRRQDQITQAVKRFLSAPTSNNRKTSCPKGHGYTPENTRLYRGKRYCKTCNV